VVVALATVSAFFVGAASSAFAATHSWTFGSSSVSGAVSPFANGIGPLPAAPSSEAGLDGGADLSDGTTPAPGGLETGFLKGNESYNGSYTTTVVDWTLPQGVTIHTDPGCGGPGNPGNYCVFVPYATCAPDSSTYITVSGNEVEWRVACAPGQFLYWAAELDSLISTPGIFDTSVQFKVGVYKRTKGTNMWQIKMPSSFFVGAP
jgi:hypothetical protein